MDAAGGGQAAALKYSVSTSAGVFHASVLRGRLFNAAATASMDTGSLPLVAAMTIKQKRSQIAWPDVCLLADC